MHRVIRWTSLCVRKLKSGMVCIRHCMTELKKHVFPRLFMARASFLVGGR